MVSWRSIPIFFQNKRLHLHLLQVGQNTTYNRQKVCRAELDVCVWMLIAWSCEGGLCEKRPGHSPMLDKASSTWFQPASKWIHQWTQLRPSAKWHRDVAALVKMYLRKGKLLDSRVRRRGGGWGGRVGEWEGKHVEQPCKYYGQ